VVHALAAIRDRGTSPVPLVVFIGEGHLRHDVAQLADRLRLGDRVRFLGQRDDVPDIVGASDMLALVSAREGLPRCLLEAMSMGVPVIASTARGSRDLLADGRGLLFPVGDVSALAAAICETMHDAACCRRRAESARTWVAQHAELAKLLDAHATLYDAALDGHSVASVPLPTDRSAKPADRRLTSAA